MRDKVGPPPTARMQTNKAPRRSTGAGNFLRVYDMLIFALSPRMDLTTQVALTSLRRRATA
jgi:hypothetical protein